jgi:hypothetical protein
MATAANTARRAASVFAGRLTVICLLVSLRHLDDLRREAVGALQRAPDEFLGLTDRNLLVRLDMLVDRDFLPVSACPSSLAKSALGCLFGRGGS